MRALTLLTCLVLTGCFPRLDIKETGGPDAGGSSSDGSVDGAGSGADASGDDAGGTGDGSGSSGDGSGSSGDGSSGDGSSGDGSGSDGSGSSGTTEPSTCTAWADGDGDGYGAGVAVELEPCDSLPSGYVTNDDDCDDGNDAVNPDATEICNSIDDDCDGDVDDDDASLDASTASTWYIDSDGDTYGDASASILACSMPGGYADNTDDCDDADTSVNPGATEVCNGIDDDCDSTVDSAAVCPCNLERNGSHTYLFCEDVVTWHEAEAACEAETNYKLAVITDATEQAWVWATASSYNSWYWWWIGLHNQSASASEEPNLGFEWVDGSTVSYTEWYPFSPWEQPDDYHGDEDCVHIDPSHGYWNDLNCNIDNWYGSQVYYICESTVP